MPEAFVWPVRVYIEDTDAGGIVFYANYLKFMERARTEYIRALGIDYRRPADVDVGYVVAHLEISYRRPARLDDLLLVRTKVAGKGRTYMCFEQNITNEKNELMVTGQVKVACVELGTGKPVRLPENLAAALDGVCPRQE